MFLIEKPERILYHLEAIDLENDEYLFWDSTGAGVRVSIVSGAVKIARCDQSMSVSQAFEAYSHSIGLSVGLQGSPIEIWARIQSQLPSRKPFWARLFTR